MENPNKRRAARALRNIIPIVAIIIVIVIAPLDLVPPWIAPLPDTVQAQVDDAIDYGLDGIIVCVDQEARFKEPAFMPKSTYKKIRLASDGLKYCQTYDACVGARRL